MISFFLLYLGEMVQFDCIFFKWVETNNYLYTIGVATRTRNQKNTHKIVVHLHSSEATWRNIHHVGWYLPGRYQGNFQGYVSLPEGFWLHLGAQLWSQAFTAPTRSMNAP